MDSRVPKGVDPTVLNMGKDTRRLDIGSLICGPVLLLIPRSMHPNTITAINHLLNWCLLLLAALSASVEVHKRMRMLSRSGMHFIREALNLIVVCIRKSQNFSMPDDQGQLRIGCLAICSLLNFICMMLDCLDGMHARNTNQCSKLGEVLDHWLDSAHVPAVCGGVLLAFQLDDWAFVSIQILNSMIYCCQLIVYHFKLVFLQTSGVEAQIGTSALYLVAAFLDTMPAGRTVPYSFRNLS